MNDNILLLQKSLTELTSAPLSSKIASVKKDDTSDGTDALKAELESESEIDLSNLDNQMSNNWVNPYLDMFQDQFVCQYAHSLVASDPTLDATDITFVYGNAKHTNVLPLLREPRLHHPPSIRSLRQKV